jgi:threonine/homoserine/homoserine lactone efflux protein
MARLALKSRLDFLYTPNLPYHSDRMLFSTLFKGFVMGIVVASPVGPIGLLCLRKNIQKDRVHGLMAAGGIAVAYGLMVLLILFGLKEYGSLLEKLEAYFEFIGGGLLAFMGAKSFFNRQASAASDLPADAKSCWLDFAATFLFTILNPFSFAIFTVILSALGLLERLLDPALDVEFALSVVAGTLVFWAVLNHFLHVSKTSSPDLIHKVLNYVTGVGLVFFGLVIFLHGFIR